MSLIASSLHRSKAAFISSINDTLKALFNYANTLPSKNVGSQRYREGYEKRQEINSVLSDIHGMTSFSELETRLEEALESNYQHGRQQNKLLVNRGPLHAYWIKSWLSPKGKHNQVAGNRLSKSTTEDLLIDLKEAVEGAKLGLAPR